MGKMIVLLGTEHRLQEAEKRPGNIDDPAYRRLIEQLMEGYRFDFVFEEIGGLGPTFAEKFALAKLGKERYLDVDTFDGPRPKTSETYWIGRPNLDTNQWPSAIEQYVEVHYCREAAWFRAVREREFERALLVCGEAHLLSLGYQFRRDGFDPHAYCYMPYDKLAGK